METLVYRLRLSGALHLGIQGFAREGSAQTVPSDTLFSALVAAWSELGIDLDAILADFGAAPPLVVSSTFPFVRDIRLFPRPLVRVVPREDEQLSRNKAHWVSESLWSQLVSGHPLTRLESALAQGGEVWAHGPECAQIERGPRRGQASEPCWQMSTIPRVALDRATNSSQVFRAGRISYREDCGLWFAARVADDAWRLRLEAGLSLLADHGLGGLRSIGHGAFSWERWQGADIPEAQQGSGYVTNLARYAPPPAEAGALLDACAHYRLELVPGWFRADGRNWRRRSVRMVTEGSLLRMPVSGQLVNVTPQAIRPSHPIYRYGYAFPIAVSQEAVPAPQEAVYG